MSDFTGNALGKMPILDLRVVLKVNGDCTNAGYIDLSSLTITSWTVISWMLGPSSLAHVAGCLKDGVNASGTRMQSSIGVIGFSLC